MFIAFSFVYAAAGPRTFKDRKKMNVGKKNHRSMRPAGNRLWRGAMGALALALGAACALPAHAAYPDHPVQIIISFPPAGATDVLARAIGQKLSIELKQSVVVQNRPGGGGIIGLAAAAKSPSDGYTLYLAAVTNLAIAAALYQNQPVSLIDSFAPIAGIGNVPHVLVVPASLPVNNVGELITYLKASPDKYNFASQGTGTLSHLESELFKRKAGVSLQHIPYKGSSQALPELAGGSSVMMFDSGPGSMALVDAGKLKFLAVVSSKRISLLPDVPTMAEQGVQGLVANNVFGFSAPKGTPADVIAVIDQALRKVLAEPDLQKAMAAQGAELVYNPAASYEATIRDENKTWAAVVKDANVKLD
jgi:tripartite-type tricarboxylate transporter receptor subunit TctC